MPDPDYKALCAELLAAMQTDDWEECEEVWARAQAALEARPEPVAPTDAASRVAHYLEQRRLIRGLDPEVINALHAGTDEPRQAALTVRDLEALARWGIPANALPTPRDH
jgi:hypothetical protein